jgi:hypothetical protein
MERQATNAGEEQLRAELLRECEVMVEELMGVMKRTPDTNIIGGSEWGVQDAVMKAKRVFFEKIVQAKARSADARLREAFSPSGPRPGPGEGSQAARQG